MENKFKTRGQERGYRDDRTTYFDVARQLDFYSRDFMERTEYRVKLDLEIEVACIVEERKLFRESSDSILNNVLNTEKIYSSYDKDTLLNYVRDYKKSFLLIREFNIKDVRSIELLKDAFINLYAKYLIFNNEQNNIWDNINAINNEIEKLGMPKKENKIIFRAIEKYMPKNADLKSIREIIKKKGHELVNALIILSKEISRRTNIDLNVEEEFKIIENTEKIIEENLNQEVEKNETEIKKCSEDKEVMNKVHEEVDYKKTIEKLKEELEIERYMYKEEIKGLKEENEELKRRNIESAEYTIKQSKKVFFDLLKVLTDINNGSILDKFYLVSEEKEENIDLKPLATNLISALGELNIFPREKSGINKEVEITEYSFYKYRLNKDISSIKSAKGIVKSPSWFYKNEEIIKEFVEIKEEK